MTSLTLDLIAPVVMASTTLMVLTGCAHPAQWTPPPQQPVSGVATNPGILRSRLPRLAGEELDLHSNEVSGQSTPGVVEVGLHAALPPSPTSGRAQSLREATRSIVPTEYTVRLASCVDQQAPASWNPTGNWIEALNELLLTLRLSATVDHDLKQVLIDRPSAINPNEPRDWVVLRSDVTLRRALERWLAPACVQMEWDVAFPLDIRADRVYRGVNLWTALRTLAEELELSDAPIQIIRYPNAVRIASGQLR